MKRPIVRNLSIGAGIAVLFAILLIQSQAIDVSQHNRYISQLRQLIERDARLNQTILQARYGMLQHYDPVNQELAALEQLQSHLSSPPAFISRKGQAEIQALLQDYRAFFQQKDELSESFKTQYATLRNSLAYFPIAIATVIEQSSQSPELVRQLNQLLRDVLIYSLTPSQALEITIGNQIETIRNRQSQLPAAVERAELEVALTHAEIVVQHLAPVDSLVESIVELPTVQAGEQLAQAYELHHQRAVRTVIIYRLGLYLLSVAAIIGTAAWIIFKLRQSAAAIRRAEAKYHSIFENSVNGIFQISPQGKIISANPALARIYGYDSPESICASVENADRELYVLPEERAKFKQLVEQRGAVSDFELQAYRQDNTLIWVSESTRAVRDRDGQLLYYEGMVVDITARKQIEDCLRMEQSKSERLLLNILPKEIAEQLKQSSDLLAQSNKEVLIAEQFEQVTILFADIVDFTPLSAQTPAKELVNLLNQIFSLFDGLAQRHRIEKIKTIGDAYMVAGGLPMPRRDHADAIADMALEMQSAIGNLRTDNDRSFQIRIGMNTGPVVAGVIGQQKFIYDLWGDSVNVASRMESSGLPGKIQVTDTTYHLLKDKYEFEERGQIQVKGKGETTTYWLVGRKLCEI